MWPEVYNGYFSRMTDAERDTIQYELFSGPDKIRNLSNDEVESALREMSKAKGIGKSPKTGVLRAFILKARKDSREDNSPRFRCELCDGTGVLHYRESVFPDGRREIGEKPGASHQNTAIPCACSAGRRIAERWYPDDRVREQIHEMSMEVIKSQ